MTNFLPIVAVLGAAALGLTATANTAPARSSSADATIEPATCRKAWHRGHRESCRPRCARAVHYQRGPPRPATLALALFSGVTWRGGRCPLN